MHSILDMTRQCTYAPSTTQRSPPMTMPRACRRPARNSLASPQGHSPDSIQQLYPALSLEAVYGAIAFSPIGIRSINIWSCRNSFVIKSAGARAESKRGDATASCISKVHGPAAP